MPYNSVGSGLARYQGRPSRAVRHVPDGGSRRAP